MSAALIVDIGTMLLSAILSAGVQSVLTMVVITGGIPALAIATVSAIDAGVKRRGRLGVMPDGVLRRLATRLRATPEGGR